MDIYDHYREQPRGCRPFVVVCIIAAIVFVVVCATGCRTVKTETVTKINWKDSTDIHVVNDTNRVTVIDTVKVEVHSTKTTENGTQIQFGAGGGTYNSKTGEATNVIGVTESSKSTENKDSIANLKHQLEAYQAKCDSLAHQMYNYSSELYEKKESGRSGWDRFCTWWFLITAVLLLAKVACWVMEKIPTTAPYIATLRKFIPFL